MARVAMLLANDHTRDSRVERECRVLTGAGHEVTVFCHGGDGLPVEETREGVRIARIPMPSWDARRGVARLPSLLGWFDRNRPLADAAEAWRPEFVHDHDLETLLPAGRLARGLGVPQIHDDHELGLEKILYQSASTVRGAKRWAMKGVGEFLHARGRRLQEEWLPRCAAVITVSEGCAEVLARFGVEPLVLRNLPSLSDLPPDPRLRERTGLAPGVKVALCQGTMTEATAPDACVSAARHLPEEWAVVFVGVTWMRDRLEEQARREGLEHRVKCIPPVPPSELLGYTRAATVGLTPVRVLNASERLGLSNKLFEYMHAGIPIVTSEGTAQAEVVREVGGGEVVAGLDPRDLAAAILRLDGLEETEKRALRERLLRAAREKYCWEVEGEKLRELYASLV